MPLNSLYNSFKPIFYISVIFGTMPLRLIKKPYLHLKPTKYGIYYLLLCLTCVLIHGMATPWFFVKTRSSTLLLEPDVDATNTSTYVKFIRNQTSAQILTMKVLNNLINTFMSVGSYTVSLFFVLNKLPMFQSYLADVDRGLVPFMKFNPRINYYIALLLTGYFIIMFATICSFYIFVVISQKGGFTFQLWSTFLLFVVFSSFSSECQFLDLALCLLYRFRAINDFLKIYSTQREMFNAFIPLSYSKKVTVKQRLTVRRVELAHQCNNKLCDLIEDLNCIYKLQLLLTVSGCFIKILFNIYFALFASFINDKKRNDDIQTVNTILWTTFYCTRFLVISIVACNTSGEANKTKSIVSSVNRRSFDSEMKEELNIFLQNTSNQNFKFNACGLFTLSTQLITSAVASGTTYLVILIQFRPPVS
ncbi:hypothetical protein O3M35_012723 [Rhynocoris fuscipes]|uniref:Gustatory receptor n=1 Tax=Rhynocoris fuscipes TaxID=488301 RepID=A0AAW1CUY0_9HEMI